MNVLITGAKGGLGADVTIAFLNAGWTVAGASRSIADTDFASDRFLAFPSALESVAAAGALVASVRDRLHRIDAAVHLVGGFAGGPTVAETDEATLDKMLELNLKTAFRVSRAVLPIMREQGAGRVLFVGSRSAVSPIEGLGVYSASKAALVSLAGTIARENRDRNVTANAVLPGTMDTPANRAAMPDADPARWVRPADVAATLVLLASGAGAAINGAAIPLFAGEP